jgi:hypothetical protein
MHPFKPRSIFGFYILMYLIPIFIPFYIVNRLCDKLIINDHLNSDVVLMLGFCSLAILFWTIFFVVYFTKIRTNNPRLYGKVFLADAASPTQTRNSTDISREQESNNE